jgi:O-antigen ligase
MIAQQAVGTSVSIIPGVTGVGAATVLTQEFGDVARVSLRGSAIVYVMLLPAFILYVTPEYSKRRKWLLLFPVVLLPLAIAFTFDRNMWIGATLAMVVFVLIAGFESKKVLFLIVAWIVVASLLVPLASTFHPRVDSIMKALSLRAASLFAGDELEYDSSTQWRLRENSLAIPKIQEHPILGLGPGSEWRRPMIEGGDYLTHYIHNAYLYLLLDLGIVGFLSFLCISILALVRGLSSWRTLREPVMRGLVLGFTLSFIAVLSSSMTSPRLLEPSFAPLIGVMLGVNEVAIRLGGRQS